MTDILTSNASDKVRSKKAPLLSRTRKALQVLQVSARDQNVLVSSPVIMAKKEKDLKSSEESFKISKHNDQAIKVTVPRRSKRKNINCENQDKVASKEEEPSSSKSLKMKIAKSSRSKKKVANVKKPKNEQILPHQSSLDSYISVGSKASETAAVDVPSERKELSGTNSDTLLDGESVRVFNSASDETDMLTSDVPTDTYWKLMAEQRRKALEVAVYENARLKDELEVLEAENSQLKTVLKEAEKIIEIVKASL